MTRRIWHNIEGETEKTRTKPKCSQRFSRSSSSPLILTRKETSRPSESRAPTRTRPFCFALRSDSLHCTWYNNINAAAQVLQRNERCLTHGSGREELRRLVLVNGLMERQSDAPNSCPFTFTKPA
jgi:hypothetical protein